MNPDRHRNRRGGPIRFAFAAAAALSLAGCQAAVTPTTGYAAAASPQGPPAPVPSGAVAPEPSPVAVAAPATEEPAAAPVALAAPAHAVSVVAQPEPDAAQEPAPNERAPAATAARSTGFNLYGQFEGVREAPMGPADADGQLRRVTFTTEGDDFDVAPDPDGERLYFASTRHRATADLYRQAIGGTSVTQLTNDPANDVMPAVSPDGRRVAFASDRSGTWDLYLMDADGGRAVKLTDDPAHNVHPSFSPDGKKLVYSSFSEHAGAWELVVIDVDKPTKKQIIGRGLFPVWSPASDTIAFQRARERGSRWFSVWTVQLVDGEATLPTEVAVSSNAAVITPRWSPDGEMLVFCTVLDPAGEDPGQPTRADIWVVGRDGSGRAKLTTGDAANLQPSWGPDGRIYFISDRGSATGEDGTGVENIWSVQPRGLLVRSEPAGGSGSSADAGQMQAGVAAGP